MRKEIFHTEQFYHIYNRGVDKRLLFLTNNDREFFVTLLAKCKKNYVNILAFCLMPNHFHFLLQQTTDQGISKFLHLFSTHYAMYFNRRYERKGRLFESPFKAEWINTPSYFLHISRYIHLNPYKLFPKSKVLDEAYLEKCLLFLEHYPWSSYKDYLSPKLIHNFLVIAPIRHCFSGPRDYKEFMRQGLLLTQAENQLIHKGLASFKSLE